MAHDEQLSWVPFTDLLTYPRVRTHRPEELDKLASSLKVQGQLQPGRGRPKEGKVELYIGHGRYLAAQSLSWESLQVIVSEKTDQEVDLEMLHENLDRQDLDPVTEAKEYAYMMQAHGWSEADMAQKAGVTQQAISHSLVLLTLSPTVQTLTTQIVISKTHLLVISKLKNELLQTQAVEQVVREGLSVRQTEALVKQLSGPVADKPGPKTNPFDQLWPGLPTGVAGKFERGRIVLSWPNAQYPDLHVLLQALDSTAPAALVQPNKRSPTSDAKSSGITAS